MAAPAPPELRPIRDLATDLGIPEDSLMTYGRFRAKVDWRLARREDRRPGRLVLVSAITPTPAGEGKTTVSIGLAQGLARIGEKVALALRQPSMGPLFGVKGGATGGGRSTVEPSAEINLGLNGDFSAVAQAHNLLAAALDNALHQRALPTLDPRRILLPRVMDMNDRALRRIVIGLGGNGMGVPREDHFDIVAASEVMAILALASDWSDLRARLGRILVGLTYDGVGVAAESLGCAGAMAVILRDALHPNLVQTREHVPAFVHCGPFANIAHGSNSILATRMALSHADWAVTEAGFGFDLGAEKFFDITCRVGGFAPSACVLVATVRALKMHGGVKKSALKQPDPEAVARGLPNLEKHIENIGKFGVPVVVAVNRFAEDTPEEMAVIENRAGELGVPVAIADIFAQGGTGGTELAHRVREAALGPEPLLQPLYDLSASPEEKVSTIARNIYGAESVKWTAEARQDLSSYQKLGIGDLAVCMAKTQSSLSDDPKRLGRPKGFDLTVRRVELAAGAGFLVPLTGDILRMPGLPKDPAFLGMELGPDGTVTGLA